MVSMPARSLKNQPQLRVHEQRVPLGVEEHPGLVAVADDVPRRRTRPSRRCRSAAPGTRRGPPRGRAAAPCRAARRRRPPSRAGRRALAGGGRARPGSSPRPHRCGSRSRPSTAARRARTTTRWCAPGRRRRAATRRGGRPAGARARRRRARRRPGPARRPRRRRRGGGRTSRRRWRRPRARPGRGRRRGSAGSTAPRRRGCGTSDAVVDDEVDGAIGVVGVAPAVQAAARRLVGVDLAGREDREADALLGEDAQHEVVHGGLGQPHARRGAARSGS